MEWTEEDALLALISVPSLGPAKIRKLVGAGGSARELLSCPERWRAAGGSSGTGLGPPELARLAEAQRSAMGAAGAAALAWGDPAYPGELHHLDHPPPLLLLRGRREAFEPGRQRVAVVGARACTPYGRGQARRFASGLASAGVVVVSGAARGIDQAAMEGALDAGGLVIAVLGTGLDQPYPREAIPLLDAIVAGGGTVLTEFPCGVGPHRGNFPRRNRIMAALARGVLVVQAAPKSGSMVTVSWALDLGREVYAVPGSIECLASRGPHQLIRDGAQLVESPNEIAAQLTGGPGGDPGDAHHPVLAALAGGDRGLEDLAAELQREPELLQLDLVELELRGLVTRLMGGLYHRSGPRPS